MRYFELQNFYKIPIRIRNPIFSREFVFRYIVDQVLYHVYGSF